MNEMRKFYSKLSNDKIKITITIKETMFQSVFNDVFSMLILSFGMYFNYTFCGNSKIMSGFFILILISTMASIANGKYKKELNLLEAKEFIQKLEEAQG